MEGCTWGILHRAEQKACLKESDFGVLNHKFLLIAVLGQAVFVPCYFAVQLTGTREGTFRCCLSSGRPREVLLPQDLLTVSSSSP